MASPTVLLTPALLHSLRTHASLPKHTWYFIAGVTLSMLNRPDEVGNVLRYAIDGLGERDEQLRVVRRMREALVKSAAIGGLPKVG
jgi:hypothetical protein